MDFDLFVIGGGSAGVRCGRIAAGHGAHEFVGDEYREVEVAQRERIPLGVDEGLDIRMIAAQRRHHGAAPRAGARMTILSSWAAPAGVKLPARRPIPMSVEGPCCRS